MEEVESCKYHRTSIYRQQSPPLELRQSIQGRNQLERVPSPPGRRSKTCWRSDGQDQLDGRENPMSSYRLELVHREPLTEMLAEFAGSLWWREAVGEWFVRFTDLH